MISVQPGVLNLFENMEEPVEFDITYKRLVRNRLPIVLFMGLLSECFVTRMKGVSGNAVIMAATGNCHALKSSTILPSSDCLHLSSFAGSIRG